MTPQHEITLSWIDGERNLLTVRWTNSPFVVLSSFNVWQIQDKITRKRAEAERAK